MFKNVIFENFDKQWILEFGDGSQGFVLKLLITAHVAGYFG